MAIRAPDGANKPTHNRIGLVFLGHHKLFVLVVAVLHIPVTRVSNVLGVEEAEFDTLGKSVSAHRSWETHSPCTGGKSPVSGG